MNNTLLRFKSHYDVMSRFTLKKKRNLKLVCYYKGRKGQTAGGPSCLVNKTLLPRQGESRIHGP